MIRLRPEHHCDEMETTDDTESMETEMIATEYNAMSNPEMMTENDYHESFANPPEGSEPEIGSGNSHPRRPEISTVSPSPETAPTLPRPGARGHAAMEPETDPSSCAVRPE